MTLASVDGLPALPEREWSDHIARYHHTVFLCLLALGIPYERARELAQEVWVKLMSQHEKGAVARLELPGLALTQARFLGLAELRRVRTGPEVPGVETPDAPRSERLEERVWTRQELTRVLAALERESALTRRIFERVYEDPGTPHAEIAAEVGLSVQRVRQILCEVRKRLRALVEEP